ncbi:UNVERIFIED_CONTAM: hypothetical protein FKN15_006421 [Acipenser sinensis]
MSSTSGTTLKTLNYQRREGHGRDHCCVPVCSASARYNSEAGQQRWWEQEIPVNGMIQKGELITYNLSELIKPEAYEVRLTPITKFGEGDSTIRMIKYSGQYHGGGSYTKLLKQRGAAVQPNVADREAILAASECKPSLTSLV